MWPWLRNLLGLEEGKSTLAERGENMAARFLRDQGLKILQRNFKTAVGEIDIIAREDDVLVFVEVKTRGYDEPSPEDQVNDTKQHQITKAAKVYLSRFGVPPAARFDVVAVIWPQGREPIIRHTPSAFEATF